MNFPFGFYSLMMKGFQAVISSLATSRELLDEELPSKIIGFELPAALLDFKEQCMQYIQIIKSVNEQRHTSIIKSEKFLLCYSPTIAVSILQS